MDSFTNSAEWSTKFKNDLPDSAFLYIEKGGKKDKEGKTSPRSLRHFPYRDTDGKVDRAHILNAIARIPQAKFLNQKQKDRLQARARAIYLKYVKYNSKKANSFVKAMNAVAKKDDTITLRELIAGQTYQTLVRLYENNPCVKKCLEDQYGKTWKQNLFKFLTKIATTTNSQILPFIEAIVMAEGHRWFEDNCPHCFMEVVTAEEAKIIRDFRSINGYGTIVPKACRDKIEKDPALRASIERYYTFLKATAMYDEFGVQIRTPEDIYRLLFEYIRTLCGMGVEEWSERIVN